MRYSVVQKCKKQTGYEAIPEEDVTIDFQKLKPLLEKNDYFSILRETKVVFILTTKKGKKVSLFPSGKLMIYRVEEEEANEVIAEILPLLNSSLVF